ncbi:hypothetical protein [Kitasatospora sp. NPDC005751]|uniref:hypothetical protein n=1 Tax=Kitasatospora sp. NPDC005751 TaxID=3157064 RepID=UPI0033C8D461
MPPQPVALALAVHAADFAELARLGLFGPLGFRDYLWRTQARLRALRGQGIEVHLRVFEPADYRDYCEAFGLDPGSAAARVAYAADPELAGEPFVYGGEQLSELLPVLVDDHLARVRISIACAALLDAVGDGPSGQSRLVAVMHHVTGVYLALAEGAGEGGHLLTLRCHGPEDGEHLTAAADVRGDGGRVLLGGRDAEAFCATLAAGVALGGAGALLLHGDPAAPGGPVVRGWALAAGRLRPMTAREVVDALADDAALGVPFPPGAVPLPGFPLPAAPPPGAAPPSGAPPWPGGASDPGDRGPEGGGPLG